MTKNFTSQPRKQRLQRYTAPHHVARKQMASHLSEELLLKYNRRSLTVIKGDEVKVLRGDFAGTNGKVLEIDASERKVTVEGVINKKADGTEVARAIDPSNLLLVKLNLEDQRRRTKLESLSESSKKGETGKERTEKATKAKKAPAKKTAAPKKEA